MQLTSLLLLLPLLSGSAPDVSAADQALMDRQRPSYPLDACPISGKKLAADVKPQEMLVQGRLVRLCCPKCVAAVEKDPAPILAKIDAAVIQAQKASYPLETCVISGEKFGGEMGEPVDYIYGTRLVRFCCKGCVAKFEKDPAASMAKIDAALIAAQKESYPLAKCVVSGEELGGMGAPVDYLYGTRLVRFCCKGCVAKFEKEPAKFLTQIDEAAKKPAGAKGM
ncbi:MAG: hypothetical protein AB1726_08705 [Planctomycetota bacterium]